MSADARPLAYRLGREAAFDRLLLVPGRAVTTFWGHSNVFGPTDFLDFRMGRSLNENAGNAGTPELMRSELYPTFWRRAISQKNNG